MRFQRGDANTDGDVVVTDAVFLLHFLFSGGNLKLECEKAADADDSGALELTDALFLLNFLFAGGPSPAAPHGACGVDGTGDALGCETYAPCGG